MLVFLTVIGAVLSAYFLSEMASQPDLLFWQFVGGIALVLGINGVRFLVWGFVHKKYPLSYSYPYTALFFPMILVLAIWQGHQIHTLQYLGILVISVGVFLLTQTEKQA